MKSWQDLIVDVKDYPKPGIVFKDITPLLRNPGAFSEVLHLFEKHILPLRPTAILGIESRGFIFASALAYSSKTGLVLARKPGKLPRETWSENYTLEYGEDSLEIHKSELGPGDRVVIVDDVLATGGTAKACVQLVKKSGAELVACAFLMELDFLSGREKLPEGQVHSLLHF